MLRRFKKKDISIKNIYLFLLHLSKKIYKETKKKELCNNTQIYISRGIEVPTAIDKFTRRLINSQAYINYKLWHRIAPSPLSTSYTKFRSKSSQKIDVRAKDINLIKYAPIFSLSIMSILYCFTFILWYNSKMVSSLDFWKYS